MIRLPNVPGLQSQAIGAPQMRPAVAAAPAAALGSLAQSLADVSDQFHGTALRIQKLENARAVSEARQGLARDYAQHQLDLQTDPDPASRIQKTAAFLSGYKGRMDAPELPPAVREELLGHFDAFATEATIRQAQDSASLAAKLGEIAFKNEAAEALRARDPAALDAALATAMDSGLMLPGEDEPFRQEFARTQTLDLMQSAIAEEPRGLLADLAKDDFLTRFPALAPEDVPRLQQAAEQAVQDKRSEQLDLIDEAFNAGKLEVDDVEAADYLTPKDVSRIKRALLATQPPDVSKHSAAWDELFKLRDAANNPAISNPQYAELWNNTRTKVLSLLPPDFQGDINQELSYRSPANRNAGTKPTASLTPKAMQTEYKSLATQRLKKAYDEGLLGDIQDPKSASAKHAYTRFEDARVAVGKFIDAHPDATYPEIRDHLSSVLSGVVADGKPLISLPALPAPVSFDTMATEALGLPAPGTGDPGMVLPPK
jgi:hypothetical protein